VVLTLLLYSRLRFRLHFCRQYHKHQPLLTWVSVNHVSQTSSARLFRVAEARQNSAATVRKSEDAIANDCMTMRTQFALEYHYYVIDDQHEISILETSTTKSSTFNLNWTWGLPGTHSMRGNDTQADSDSYATDKNARATSDCWRRNTYSNVTI
jgi:hypothetical protein